MASEGVPLGPKRCRARARAVPALASADIVFDNSVTRLVLTSPKDGERASTAVGIAPLGSRLTLNCKSVALDDAGRFSTPVSGSVLVFKLLTKDGAEAHWVRRVGR